MRKNIQFYHYYVQNLIYLYFDRYHSLTDFSGTWSAQNIIKCSKGQFKLSISMEGGGALFEAVVRPYQVSHVQIIIMNNVIRSCSHRAFSPTLNISDKKEMVYKVIKTDLAPPAPLL